MTNEIDHGNNRDRHLCWVFSKCERDDASTPPPTGGAVANADAASDSVPTVTPRGVTKQCFVHPGR